MIAPMPPRTVVHSDGTITRRRGSTTGHPEVLAAMRCSRPYGLPRGIARNTRKRYRQGRATVADVQRAFLEQFGAGPS